ncbi:MAG: winged helix-turn-helix domain-containing protein [Steroidobacteraceae bacterium]
MSGFPAEFVDTPSFKFGPFVLVPERQLLLQNGTPVRIGGRALDILIVLVESAGQIVSKTEMIRRVWPTTVVEYENLKVNMVALRRALGEDSNKPSYIATVTAEGTNSSPPFMRQSMSSHSHRSIRANVPISHCPQSPSQLSEGTRSLQ